MQKAGGSPGYAERVDRAVVLSVLGVLTFGAWGYLFYQDWAMRHMDVVSMAMPSVHAWGAADLVLVLVTWAAMMAAMMLPSVAPMVVLYTRISAWRNPPARALPYAWIFLSGYLAVWAGFSVLATLLQWGLHTAALTSPMMVATPAFGGMLLVAAGVYQWTPLKQACLAQCRAPLGFFLNRWRDGASGALAMGAMHGVFCAGCCWMLMLLMFVLGMMNLLWIVALSLVVLMEKLFPQGERIAKAGGVVFIGWGIWLLLQAALSM